MSSRLLELARNPFPGLRSFQEDEDFLFFGREGQIAELLKRLRNQHFLAVVGTSGSGKSSLIRAGLIPALHRGTLVSAGSKWEVLYARPGGSPMENLARALEQSDLYETSNELFPRLLACLNRSRSGLIDAIQQSSIESDTNLLLVIDQFEEVFRYRRRDEQSLVKAADFVAALLEASMRSQRRVYIIVTMRSDYLGDCSIFPGLAEAVNRGEYLIPRMSREEMRDAIVNPIRVAGGTISNRLLQKLLNRVSDNHDQLPLLQHALMRTWDAWEQGHPDNEPADLSHFESAGEVEFAISQHADEVLAFLPEYQRLIAKRLFQALTEMGSDQRETRRPTRLQDLRKIIDCKEDDLLAVIDAFRDKSCAFITPTQGMTIYGDTYVDISHESLMRAWSTLKEWVQQEHQSARIYRRLAETATLHAEGRSGLYRDPDLQVATAWRRDNPTNAAWASRYHESYELALNFLDRSQAEQKREMERQETARRRELEQSRALAELQSRRAEESQRAARRLRITSIVMAGLAAIGIALSITSIFFFLQLQESDRKRNQEEKQSLVNMRIAEERTRFVIETTNRLSNDVDDIPLSVRNSFTDLFRNGIEQLGNQSNADKKNSETDLVMQVTLLWSLYELGAESRTQVSYEYATLLTNAESFIDEISQNMESSNEDKLKASLQLQRLLGIIYFELDRSNDSARLWDSLLKFTDRIPGKIKSTESNNLIALNSRLDAFLHLARIRGEPKGYGLTADLIEKACDCDVGILESIRTINSNTHEINEAFGLLARAYHERALIEKNNAPATAPSWFQKSKEMIEKIQGGVGSQLAKIQAINLSELQASPVTTRKPSTSNGN
jgi:hypothetical protein